MRRVVEPEILDTLRPDDPLAIGSRRDLRRINAWMGHPRFLRRALKTRLAGQAPGPVVEIGAGDGEFFLQVARRFAPAWPRPQVTLLDRLPAVSDPVRAALARAGWSAEPLVADVFAWPMPVERPAAVVANLFLHHFEPGTLARLLALVAERSPLFIALEPRRVAQPWICRELIRLIGCNRVTRHDAYLSVRAGFAGRELSAAWPDAQNWELTERRAGLFSHLFIAQRRA